MEKHDHLCQHKQHSPMPARLSRALASVWQILRAVLRGYTTGQPIDEERPRKGCC
jgi:hypothetical protein